MTTPSEIIRCLKLDMDGDLRAAAEYAEKIARSAAVNPWADATDAANYAEAGRRLRAELAQIREDAADFRERVAAGDPTAINQSEQYP